MNIKIISNILLVCLILISLIVPSKHVLHIFQQNRYDYKRYFDWIINYFKNNLIIVFVYLVLISISFFLKSINSVIIYVSIIYGIIAFIFFYKESKKEYIKPLVYTSRVKRQIFVLLLLDLIVIVLFLHYFDELYLLLFLFISLIMNWILILLANFLLMPIEKLVQNYYLNDAKKKLRSHLSLINIGITGSFGKTSSKNIIQSIISEEYRSLMTPASFNTPMGITRTIREQLKPSHQVFVCEMGADHVGDIKYLSDFVNPKIGIVTSIGIQHLSTFKSLENIIKEKMILIEKLPSDGIGIINYDNEYIREYNIKNSCKIIKYGIDNSDVDYQAVNIKYSPKGSKFKVKTKEKTYSFETKLLGKHNISNILAGIALARELNVEWKDIIKAVKYIPYIEHRLEVKTINGLKFIDNAFNSNPVGAKMSLEVMKMMPKKRIIVTPGMIDLGSKQKEVNYDFGYSMKDNIDIAILVGETQTLPIKQGLDDSGFKSDNIYVVKTVKEAFALVYSIATNKDTILLENDLPDAFNV
ncbi:MAG: UDP-N-acetylmuramoyl-tripeptide--D-alanyl-D-alanine ligase [Erysipelotrichaceae bacterium]|nr:UDP-N-acetylmuramoyl-tripeptide--D-alanyl-D-alanine ligase [Erysipelotrichaceae bacterium]